MAIFEQQTTKKILLDDTVVISCFIENWRQTNGHTVSYQINCSRNYPIWKFIVPLFAFRSSSLKFGEDLHQINLGECVKDTMIFSSYIHVCKHLGFPYLCPQRKSLETRTQNLLLNDRQHYRYLNV